MKPLADECLGSSPYRLIEASWQDHAKSARQRVSGSRERSPIFVRPSSISRSRVAGGSRSVATDSSANAFSSSPSGTSEIMRCEPGPTPLRPNRPGLAESRILGLREYLPKASRNRSSPFHRCVQPVTSQRRHSGVLVSSRPTSGVKHWQSRASRHRQARSSEASAGRKRAFGNRAFASARGCPGCSPGVLCLRRADRDRRSLLMTSK